MVMSWNARVSSMVYLRKPMSIICHTKTYRISMVSLVHHNELIVYKEYKRTKMVRVLQCVFKVCPSILPSTNVMHAPPLTKVKKRN